MWGRENSDREDDLHLSMSKIYHVISPDIVGISREAHRDFPRLQRVRLLLPEDGSIIYVEANHALFIELFVWV